MRLSGGRVGPENQDLFGPKPEPCRARRLFRLPCCRGLLAGLKPAAGKPVGRWVRRFSLVSSMAIPGYPVWMRSTLGDKIYLPDQGWWL